MSDLILYLGMSVIGYFVGSRMNKAGKSLEWTGKLQTVAVIVLIVTMGMRMGANEEVTNNLNSIGLSALIITVVILICSVTAVGIARRLLGINRYGKMQKEETLDSEALEKEEEANHSNKMTYIIIASVAAGMLGGYFIVRRVFDDMAAFDSGAGLAITIGLCVLLFFIGTDLGAEGTVINNFKKVGIRIFAFPLAIGIGTMAGALICGLFLPMSMRESLAIGAGFGWYSLAPGIIMSNGFVTASAVSFMHNILREFLSFLLIPIVAKKIGHLETIALPGAASMDVCLPIVEKSTSSEIAVYSFVSGVIMSFAVPILVPLIIG